MLTVMSFNIWRSGGLSLERTIEAIRAAKADIVGLQESNLATTATIGKALGFSFVHDSRVRVRRARHHVDAHDLRGGAARSTGSISCTTPDLSLRRTRRRWTSAAA